MSEKIISIKEGKVVEKDDKDWVELIDQDNTTHRVFRSMQNNEGVWVHLDKEVDMLKGKIKDGTINGLALKLTKERKGTFWNVTGVELIENVFVKQAQKQVVDTREQSIERQVAIKEIGECWRVGKLEDKSPLVQAYKIWLQTTLNAEIGEAINEPDKVSTEETGQPLGEETGSADKGGGEEPHTIQEQIRELYVKKGWWVVSKGWTSPKVIAHIKGITGRLDIKILTDDDMTNVMSDLQAQIELK